MMNEAMDLIFLNKPEPLLPQAVDHLMPRNGSSGIVDLSKTVLILPTRTAIRKLHEALARSAAPRSINPPSWFLPMQFTEGEGVAAPASVEHLCWCRVITARSPDSLGGLFPYRRPPVLDMASASLLGTSIASLRGDLASAGLSLSEAGARGAISPARLETLLSLELEFVSELARMGFRDRISLQREGMTDPKLPEGINRIVVAGVPDLPRACEQSLISCLSAGIALQILVHDPERRGVAGFDPCGRPLTDGGASCLGIPEDRIHVRSDDRELALAVNDLCRASGGTRETTAVGVTSPEMALLLEEHLESCELGVFNPAGEPLDATAPGRLLGLLLLHLEESDFRSALRLMHHADMMAWLSRPERSFGARQFARLDELQKQLIPSTLEDLLSRWPAPHEDDAVADAQLMEAIREFIKLTGSLSQATGVDGILSFLREVHGERSLSTASAEAASFLRDWMRATRKLAADIPVREVIPLILKDLSAGIHAGEKSPRAMELQGWLELLWEDAPHLVVAGMSDGLVPEVRPVDPFLPEKSRRLLAMPDNASRLARDTYLIRSLIASRPEGAGRVDFLFARHDSEGAFRKPSRLLLSCPDEELAARVRHLFAETGRRAARPWRAAWKLGVSREKVPDHLSASSIKEYLSCPARWYFKRVGGLNQSNFAVEEIDPLDFGIMLHEVLQKFGVDPSLRNLANEVEIADALKAIWLRCFAARFGEDPPLPLVYQREIGLRRLNMAAEKQAELFADGWRIMGCELDFKGFRPQGTDEAGMPLPVNGRIDRVDRRENEDGSIEWRILDYKSGDSAEEPDKSHYTALPKSEEASTYPIHERMSLSKEIQGNRRGEKVLKHLHVRWRDLQLPIYVLIGEAVRDGAFQVKDLTIQQGSVSGGYFLLPADLEKTGVEVFKGFKGWEESAVRCLRGVSKAVADGVFWPPRHPQYDDFKGLFFDRMNDEEMNQRTAVPPQGRAS